MTTERRIALITGANRGLGFETARQLARHGFKAVLTSRDGLLGKAAADKLQGESLDVAYHPLDVTREESIGRTREFLDNAFGRLDVLVNNAGIFPERDPESGNGPSVLNADLDIARNSLEINAFGPLQLTRELLPLMRRHGYGRIVNISTGYAQLARMESSFPAYRISKAALNAVTCLFAAETREEDILVNAVDPGWIHTRMGGSGATRTPAEAAEWVVHAAGLPAGGPTGCFLKDGNGIDW